jgi:hypothetical protein
MTGKTTMTAAVGFLAGLLGWQAAGATSIDVREFTILRNGTEVGTHQVRREERDGLTRVSARSDIAVRLLGLSLYRFEYEASEEWDGLGLKRMQVEVNEDGEAFRLEGERRDDRFAWRSDKGRGDHPLPIFPTNHWNPGVLDQDAVLNTLTGSVNRVEIVPAGRELLELPTAQVPAERYRYKGDLDLTVWYSGEEWLGMRFEARDGSTIEYLCRNCAGERL